MSGRRAIKSAALLLIGAVAALATPAIARTVVDYAKNSGHLRGLPARAFQRACSEGTVAGFAEVPADVSSGWTQVTGYGRSIFEIGPVRQGSPPTCRSEVAYARHVSAGVYDVSLNSSLGSSCSMADVPRPGETLPAVVSVTSATPLVATYTTACDPNDKGFVEEVRITTAAGTPADAEFTLATMEPVVVVEP